VDDPTEGRMQEGDYLHLTRFVQFLLDRKIRMSMARHSLARSVRCGFTLLALAGAAGLLSACSDFDPPSVPPSPTAMIACSNNAEGTGYNYLACLRVHGAYGLSG
jgi:hypothetical protein